MLKGGTFSHVYLLSWPEKGGQVEGNSSSFKNVNLQIDHIVKKGSEQSMECYQKGK